MAHTCPIPKPRPPAAPIPFSTSRQPPDSTPSGAVPAPFGCLATPPTGKLGDLQGVGVSLQPEAAQALAGVLVGEVEAALQVLGRRLLQPQLLGRLLVEKTHFLGERRRGSGHAHRPHPWD